MKNKKVLITVLSVALIVLGVASSLLLKDDISDRIVNVTTACTAIIGATALFYQFRRDKNLNEATFLIEYSGIFYSTYDCAELMNELEKCRVVEGYSLDVDKYYTKIVGYLEWLETLSSLVNSDLLEISKIDNVLSYRYFLIVNNKQVQERELIVNREFYRSIFELYPKWENYKNQKKLPIIFEENSLSRSEGFEEIVSKKK